MVGACVKYRVNASLYLVWFVAISKSAIWE